MEQNSGSIATLDSKFTGLFEVVNALPNINDAQLGKIYCVKDTSSTETENKYIEWVKLKNIDDTYKFEKVGEFNAAPDLSGYARLNGATFTGKVETTSVFHPYQLFVGEIYPTSGVNYLLCSETGKRSSHKTYSTDGKIVDVGVEESFVFTLEDGSKVTKSIRVVTTTDS